MATTPDVLLDATPRPAAPPNANGSPSTRAQVGAPEARDRSAWSSAGAGFGLAMRAVPPAFRFRVAVALAAPLAALLRRAPQLRAMHHGASGVSGARDLALYLALWRMTAAGTDFDAPLRTVGLEQLTDARTAGRGVLLAAPHTMLTYLVLRYLHDARYDFAVVATNPEIRLLGTHVWIPTISATPTVLVRVRRLLRHGALVCAMIDYSPAAPLGRRTERIFETACGPMAISDALLRVAARSGARVVFVTTTADARGVVATFEAAPADAAESAERTADAFTRFIQGQVARGEASRW